MLLPYPGHTDPFLAPLLLNKGLCISRRTLVTYSALRMAERGAVCWDLLVPALRRAMFVLDQGRGCKENRRTLQRLCPDDDVAPATGYTFCAQMTI